MKLLARFCMWIAAFYCGPSSFLYSASVGEVQLAEPPVAPLIYYVDLLNRENDTFKVSLLVDDLGLKNNVFQFAATAPGTYQVMDIGRFVCKFQAFDVLGHQLACNKISQNAFQIVQPEKVVRIVYTIAETWDTDVSENQIYPMCGTSLENDHSLINGQAVFGYPRGMQARSLRIFLTRPEHWMVGTALAFDLDGALLADNYDHVVDSPILLGNLSFAAKRVRNCNIRLFAYSKNGLAVADNILARLDDIVEATSLFLDGFPVDNYTFLYHFDDFSSGAWEHSYSSFYVASEHNLEQVMDTFIERTAAHEIFHMVTPLQIHSERIHPFNFQSPKPSAHVWFYEGVTEWAAGMMQLRAGLKNIDAYLATLSKKLNFDDKMDKNFSLVDMSLYSYSQKGQHEWPNVYNRGAVVAALLDILILDSSEAKFGLREVILDLANSYGKDTAFSEDGFFQAIVKMTHPDVGDFINRYIRSTETLPVRAFFAKLGITYMPQLESGRKVADVGFQVTLTPNREVVVERVGPSFRAMGLANGDQLVRFNGITLSGHTLHEVNSRIETMKIGSILVLDTQRNGQSQVLTGRTGEKDDTIYHIFTLDRTANPRQKRLRHAWSHNLAFPSVPCR